VVVGVRVGVGVLWGGGVEGGGVSCNSAQEARFVFACDLPSERLCSCEHGVVACSRQGCADCSLI
jgi:hypothetical protein